MPDFRQSEIEGGSYVCEHCAFCGSCVPYAGVDQRV
jgi:hypothetical protein